MVLSGIPLSTEISQTSTSFVGLEGNFATIICKFLTNINPWALMGVGSATDFLIKFPDPYFSLWMHPELMLSARYLH